MIGPRPIPVIRGIYSNAPGCDEPLIAEQYALLCYIRNHECRAFDELVGAALSDIRVGGDSNIYDLCFKYPVWCRRYCEDFAKGKWT